MTPDFVNDPAGRYRRGRLLTLLVVLGTAALSLWPAVRSNLFNPAGGSVHMELPPELLSPAATAILARCLGLVLDAFFIFLLGRFAFRGGRTSTGCLIFLYSISLFGVILVGLVLLLGPTHLISLGSNLVIDGFLFKDVGKNPRSTVLFFLYAAWTVFACWVLVRSSDARFYREARRHGMLPDAVPPPLPPSPL